MLLVLCMFSGLISCNKDEEETSSEEVEILLIFDYGEYEGVEWDEDFDEEMIVIAGKNVGDFPKPKLTGYTFSGWYEDVEDSDTKLRKTTKYDGSETEIVLYAKFTKATSGDGDGGSSDGYNCAAGLHNWDIQTTPPTCTAPGTKTKTCLICHDEQADAIYSSQNKALGHKWVEDGAIDDGGWTYVALARQRTCLREGCDYVESKQLENLTSLASCTVSIDAGAWPGTAEWPAILTDGIWEGKPNAAPKGGGPLTITFQFSKATEIDQIAIACQGHGDDKFKFQVFLMYADETDFGESAVHVGTLGENGTRETAYIVDRTVDDRPILAVKIVQEVTAHGSEYWEEIAFGRIPDEE